MLERTATADLFKNTLSRIPTMFGRLAYLASLRGPDSGVYGHHGLTLMFGREESRKALVSSHEQVFLEWIKLPLEEKNQDLRTYLAGLEEPTPAVLEHWAQSEVYRGYVPAMAHLGEKEFFVKELELLIQLIRCG